MNWIVGTGLAGVISAGNHGDDAEPHPAAGSDLLENRAPGISRQRRAIVHPLPKTRSENSAGRVEDQGIKRRPVAGKSRRAKRGAGAAKIEESLRAELDITQRLAKTLVETDQHPVLASTLAPVPGLLSSIEVPAGNDRAMACWRRPTRPGQRGSECHDLTHRRPAFAEGVLHRQDVAFADEKSCSGHAISNDASDGGIGAARLRPDGYPIVFVENRGAGRDGGGHEGREANESRPEPELCHGCGLSAGNPLPAVALWSGMEVVAALKRRLCSLQTRLTVMCHLPMLLSLGSTGGLSLPVPSATKAISARPAAVEDSHRMRPPAIKASGWTRTRHRSPLGVAIVSVAMISLE